MSKLPIAYAGFFERITDPANFATSSAGNQVQCEIVDALEDFAVKEGGGVGVFSAKPMRAWPRGFFWGEVTSNASNGHSVGRLLNLPFLKRIHFSIKLFLYLLRYRPRVVFFYNPGVWDSFALLLYRLLSSVSVELVSVIQDVHAGSGGYFDWRRIDGVLSMKMARRFDLLLPISEFIANDFGFDRSKVVVFEGGITRQGRELLKVDCCSSQRYAVFAGALEPYNGIDRLVSVWRDMDPQMILHVFGRGSCESEVLRVSNECENIVFHGFSSEDVVSEWQASAAVNFCLRYPIGINSKYFFPSKFFNVLAAPGVAVVNRFDGLPSGVEEFCVIVEDDLSDLFVKIGSTKFDDGFIRVLRARRNWLCERAEWKVVIRHVLGRCLNKVG